MGDADDADATFEIGGGSIVIHKSGLPKDGDSEDGHAVAYVPTKYALHHNYPNPFNPETRITYELPQASHVVLKIYNSLGKEIRTLVMNDQETGVHTEIWDGRDDVGQEVSSGIYFIIFKAGEFVQTKKGLFLK